VVTTNTEEFWIVSSSTQRKKGGKVKTVNTHSIDMVDYPLSKKKEKDSVEEKLYIDKISPISSPRPG
jgi:hypothetical protein